jgi:hypothetical protein
MLLIEPFCGSIKRELEEVKRVGKFDARLSTFSIVEASSPSSITFEARLHP